MGQAAAGEHVNGRYRLLEVLGQGGMGRVWLARDLDENRHVAIKELFLPHDPVVLRRFLREARVPAKLHHPGIVHVFDLVEHNGSPMIVMEYIETSLAALLQSRGGRLGWRHVAAAGIDLAEALAFMHGHEVVHRDLKPGNVLMYDGRPVIADFGIARVVGGTELTQGLRIGTRQYMAPETLDGTPATAAADIWALGVMLYQAVEGRLPFDAEDANALERAIYEQEPPPTRHAGPLATVLSRLLSKNPQERPTAKQVSGMITHVMRSGQRTGTAPAARPRLAPTPSRPTVPALRPGPPPSAAPGPAAAAGSREARIREEIGRLTPRAQAPLQSLNGCGIVLLAAILNTIGFLIVGAVIELILHLTHGPLQGRPTPPWYLPTALLCGALLWIGPGVWLTIRRAAADAARERIRELEDQLGSNPPIW